MRPPLLVSLGIVLVACSSDDVGVTGVSEATTTGATDASGSGSSSGSGSDGADGGSTTEAAEPPDPRPILEREPTTTHTCVETRAMTLVPGVSSRRTDGLVTIGSEYFVLRSWSTLTLANVALDGTSLHEVVLEPEMYSFNAVASAVVDASIVLVGTNGTSLRYAVVDDDLGTVIAPKAIPGTTGTSMRAAALVPSPAGGLALLYGEADDAGHTRLRFVPLDVDGEPTASPVDVAEVGQLYAVAPASAAATSDGGWAVSYGVGEPDEGVVFFVILDADGAPRFEPQRISRDTVEGWSSALASAPGRSVLAVDDRFWVAFTEGRAGSESDLVIQLAIVDGEGRSELHQLQAPVYDMHNRWPSFVELDDRVGLMWTSGTDFTFCVGCIGDDDLHFVLLDPDAVVPASDVVIQPHTMNGIVAPIGAFVGPDMLTAASLDFHASTRPATGSLRCEPTG